MLMIELLIMLSLPAGVLMLTKKVLFFKKIGAIALCCILGLLFSLLPIPYDKSFSQLTSSVIVAIAIPLVLFGFDLWKVRMLTKDMIKGFGLQIAVTILCASAVAMIAGCLGLKHSSALGGMATGLYIGNTPNMIAVGNALLPGAQSAEVIVEASTADCIVGGGYFFIVLLIMCPIYKHFLGKRRAPEIQATASSETQGITAGNEYDYASIPKNRRSIARLIFVILLAAACLTAGAGLEYLFNKSLDGSLYIMLTVSVLGLAGSFVRPIRETKGTYQIGHYLFLIFSFGICMSIDISVLFSGIIQIFLFFAVVQTSIVIVHFLFCKLFRIDGGTALITNTAGLYGPPYIAPIALAYGERQLIAPGIICGVVGIAIGNLTGIGVGSLLSLLPPLS